VLIAVRGEFDCTGAVISANVVLTARHCIEDPMSGQRHAASALDVRTGDTFAGSTVVAQVSQVAMAPSAGVDGQDIALLILDRSVTLTPYAWSRQPPTVGSTFHGVGYGFTRPLDGMGPPANSEIRKHRGQSTVASLLGQTEFLTSTNITCNGDSGGPAFDASGTIIGVVSRGTGPNCADGDQSVYTRTDAFAQLIDDAIAGRVADAGAQPTGSDPWGGIPGQPAPGQPVPGQPAPGQPAPGQPVPGQPAPGQPVPGQPWPGTPGGVAPGSMPGSWYPPITTYPPPPSSGPGTGAFGDMDGDGCADVIDPWPTQFEPYPFDVYGYPCHTGSGDPWASDPWSAGAYDPWGSPYGY
jgi:V8-like Glu-specific endopeptidase